MTHSEKRLRGKTINGLAFGCASLWFIAGYASFAPVGLTLPEEKNTHGLRRGLHCFAASRLEYCLVAGDARVVLRQFQARFVLFCAACGITQVLVLGDDLCFVLRRGLILIVARLLVGDRRRSRG